MADGFSFRQDAQFHFGASETKLPANRNENRRQRGGQVISPQIGSGATISLPGIPRRGHARDRPALRRAGGSPRAWGAGGLPPTGGKLTDCLKGQIGVRRRSSALRCLSLISADLIWCLAINLLHAWAP